MRPPPQPGQTDLRRTEGPSSDCLPRCSVETPGGLRLRQQPALAQPGRRSRPYLHLAGAVPAGTAVAHRRLAGMAIPRAGDGTLRLSSHLHLSTTRLAAARSVACTRAGALARALAGSAGRGAARTGGGGHACRYAGTGDGAGRPGGRRPGRGVARTAGRRGRTGRRSRSGAAGRGAGATRGAAGAGGRAGADAGSGGAGRCRTGTAGSRRAAGGTVPACTTYATTGTTGSTGNAGRTGHRCAGCGGRRASTHVTRGGGLRVTAVTGS